MTLGDISDREKAIFVDAFRELRERVPGLDEDELQAVGEALIRVEQQGVRLGAAEVAAQLIELGHDVNLHFWGDEA